MPKTRKPSEQAAGPTRRAAGAITVAAVAMIGDTASGQPSGKPGAAPGHMLSKNPSKVAQTLLADFQSGKTTKEIYTDPFVVRHCYEDFDKLRKLSNAPRTSGPGPRWADVKTERVLVIDGGEAVTVLLTNRIKTTDGREFLHQSASISFLNAEGKIYRQEAYYDPTEQRRDAFLREHLAMYDGVVT